MILVGLRGSLSCALFVPILIGLLSCGQNNNSDSNDDDIQNSGVQFKSGTEFVIDGRGYFIGKGKEIVYVRQVSLDINSLGEAVINDSHTLQGFVADSGGTIGGVLSDVNINAFGVDPASLMIDQYGRIYSQVLEQKTIHALLGVADFSNTYQLGVLEMGVFIENNLSGSPVFSVLGLSSLGAIIFDRMEAVPIDDALILNAQLPNQFLLENTLANREVAHELLLFQNNQGSIVSEDGDKLLVYEVDSAGGIQAGQAVPLVLDHFREPKSTSNIVLNVGLNMQQSLDVEPFFDVDNSDSYHFRVNKEITDSLGSTHDLSFYFVKHQEPSQWMMYHVFDEVQIGAASVLDVQVQTCPNLISLHAFMPLESDGVSFNGGLDYDITVEICNIYESANSYQVDSIQSDGYGFLRFSELVVDECGSIYFNYMGSSGSDVLQSFLEYQIILTKGIGQPLGLPCSSGFGMINEERME